MTDPVLNKESKSRATAREVWTQITGNGEGLWNLFDWQSVEILERYFSEAQQHERQRCDELADRDATIARLREQRDTYYGWAQDRADEADRNAAYAVQLTEAAELASEAAYRAVMHLSLDSPGNKIAVSVLTNAKQALDAALATNPNPAGQWTAKASELRKAPEASGPVGLGPAKFDSVFRAEAREVWTTITGNGPGLWNDYDLQSIDTLEKALQRAATLSQSKASDDHITKIAALGAIDAVHHELSRALSLNERAAELLRESLATHVACSSPEEKR